VKITNPLDNILNNEVKVRVLRFFVKTDAKWNGRQIARELGGSPTTVHKALQELEGEGILSVNNIGKTHVYGLNRSNRILVDMLVPLFMKEDKILEGIIGAIKKEVETSKLKKNIISMGLFGSVKLRKDRPTSDIDIFVIVENPKDKTAVEELLDGIGVNMSKEYGNVLSPYINTVAEFKTKYAEGLPVIRNIVKSHSVIYGNKLENIL
jgi:predicted nucleotidyltransferase/biotin operon repressor